MKKKLLIPISTLFIALITMGVRCQKDKINYVYHFTEKIDIFPQQKSYHVGDTIWLQHSNPSNQLYDSRTNSYFSADTLAIGFTGVLNFVYSNPYQPVDSTCEVIYKGQQVGHTFFYQYFGCNGNSFNFKVGFVLIKTGIYEFNFTDTREVSSCSGPYSVGSGLFPPSIISYKLNFVDGNKDVWLSIPQNSRGESPKHFTEDAIDRKEIYIIKVE
jgi:hypothetical protein